MRKLISRGANFFASFFLNPKVSDLTGSFRVYRRSNFDTLIKSVKNSGYAFQMEMMIRAKNSGMKVAEVPITFVDRLMGKSKLGISEIVIYFRTVMWLYFTL
jgi:dolichol-phosphate mannosyltransferase